MNDKKYDLIVFGASSFVGEILCEHLFEKYGLDEELKWAIAGRDKKKLEQVRDSLEVQASSLNILVANSFDEASLRSLCEKAKVIVSTVGPYALYGDALLKICAETGTHYCDLCGEVQWIRKMIESNQQTAQQNGTFVVNSCGFDSIPSDMGVYFLQQQAQQLHGEYCNKVSMRCKAMKGTLSGGTVASMLNIGKEIAKDSSLLKIIANPYTLCGDNHPFKVRQDVIKGAFYDEDFSSWCSPFIMAGINTRIVHRSHLLNGVPYGNEFKYSEASLSGSGPLGWIKAQMRTVAIGLFFVLTAIKPIRALLEKYVLPKPGEGPTKAAQEAGFYDLRFIGMTPSGKKITVKVTGDRDPGYGSTAKMLTQAAVSLAFDKHQKEQGGLYTPASIFDQNFIKELEEHAGLSFEVIE